MGLFGVISLFVFLIISLSLIYSTQGARLHHHHNHHHHHNSKHNKHLHSHKESTISQPPHESPAYPPDEPPEDDDPDVDPPFYSPPVFAPPESSIAPSIPPVIVPPPPAEPPVKLPPPPAEAPVIVPPTPPPAVEAPVIVAPPPTAEPPVIVLPTPPAEPPAKSYIMPPPVPSPAPAPEPSSGEDENGNVVLDLRKFGGVGDGKTDDTDAFKMAWETACQQNDSAVAVILVPYGFKFMIQSTIFTGPCLGGLVLQLDGTIMPPDGPEAWPEKNSKRQWLVFYRVNQMSLIGGGAIDGRGQKWWDLPCKPHKGINGTTMPGPCDSPIAIRFFMSTNLTVEGIRIKDSPQFNFRFDNCKNVHIQSIHITAPALSPNTDGIHIENTNNVEIYDSVISNGDDCVSIGSGCYDVDIRNITCGPSHGISIGSLGNHNSKACVSNITVRDSVIKSSDNGVRIKTWQGGSGAVTGITFSNIHMDNVKNPIIIDQFYCLTKECTNQTSAVLVSDIVYQNIKGTYNIRTPPMRFACSDSVPCTNLTLSDVELLPAQGDLVLDPYCWNAYGDLQTLTIPPVFCLMDGSDRSLLNNQLDFCF